MKQRRREQSEAKSSRLRLVNFENSPIPALRARAEAKSMRVNGPPDQQVRWPMFSDVATTGEAKTVFDDLVAMLRDPWT